MKITKGKAGGTKGRVIKNLWGKEIIKFGGKTYQLSDTAVSVRCINKEKRTSALVLTFAVLIVLLACWAAGPFGLLATPLLLCGRRQTVTVQIDTPDEKGIIAVADKNEWKILSKYILAS